MRSKRTQESSSIGTGTAAPNGREPRDKTVLGEGECSANGDLVHIRDVEARPTHSVGLTEDVIARQHTRAVKLAPIVVLAGLGTLVALLVLGGLELFLERFLSDAVALSIPIIFGSIAAAGITYFALRRQEAFYRRTLEGRERSENARRQAERKYRDIFENAVEGIFQTRPGGGFIIANPALARMLGFESPEKLIRAWAQASRGTYYVHPERRLELQRLLDQHDIVRGFEFEVYRQDGATVWLSDNVRAVRDASGRLLYYEGTVEDITERKKTEESLRRSEMELSDFFENAATGLHWVGSDGTILRINQAELDLLGYTRDECLGHNVAEFHADRDVVDDILKRLRSGEVLRDYEARRLCKDGSIKHVSINSSVYWEEGKFIHSRCFTRDITERKRAEEELRSAKEFSEKLIQTANVIVLGLDMDARINIFNQTAEKITGYTFAELRGKSWFDKLVPRERYPHVWEEFCRLAASDNLPRPFENPILTKNGEERYIAWRNNQISVDGKVVGIIAFGNDITETKRAEQALKQSEQDFRNLFEQAHDAILVLRPENEIVLDVNERACEVYGFTRSEFVGMSLEAISKDAVRGRGEIRQTLEKGDYLNFETVQYRKDGTEMLLEINASTILYQGRLVILSINRDITERKRAEESLRKQNEYLAALHETALGLINRLDLDELLEVILTRALALVGIPGGHVYLIEPGGNEMSVKVGVGVSRDFVGARIRKGQGVAGRIWETGQALVVNDYRNWEHRLTNAGYDDLRLVGAVPLRSGSRVIGVLGVESTEEGQGLDSEQIEILNRFAQLASIALDNAQLHSAVQQELAERKRAEADISNLRRELELTMNSMEEGVHRVNRQGNIVFENPAAARMLGWEVAELLGKPAHITMHHTRKDGTTYPKSECPIYNTLRDGISRHVTDEVFCRQDGTSFPVEYLAAAMRNDRNEIVAIVVTFLDITDRKRAEEALRASERRYRDIFTFAPVGIYQSLRDGTLITANKALAEMLGYDSVDEFLKVNLADVYLTPDGRKKLIREYEDRRFAVDAEIQWKRKDGTPIWVQLSAHAIKRADGTTEYFEGFVRDVNDRKLTEAALRESEERYRELFENDRDAIYVHDLKGAYTSVNRAAERLSGYSCEEICAKHFWDLVAPEYLQQVGESLGKKLRELGETNYEVEIVNRDGVRVPVEVSSRLIYENGVAVGVQGSARDITERKRAREALLTYSRRLLEAQETERGRIARELHDQIGQMLTALKLNLHAIQSARDESEAQALIEDNLEMIDGALAQVRDLSVDLRPLLLDDLGLVTALHWYVAHQSQRTGVKAEFISDALDSDLRFSAELEIACFRIAQEALTNVARHARAKTVTVRLSRNRDYLILLIEDDGVGFDMEALQGQALASATLGLRGMQERAHAVGGRIKIDSEIDKGSQVFVELPIAMPNGKEALRKNR